MMEERIKMQCVFCKSDQFELPRENYQPSHGEMIRCANCGRLNDYTSVVRIAEGRAIEMAKAEAERIIKERFKPWKV